MSYRKRHEAPIYDDADDDAEDPAMGEDDDDAMRAGTVPPDCLDAVVKLFVTHTEPNYSLPWQMRRQTTSTSSGFVISGNRILTNAHCVDNFAVVKVKRRQSSTKYVAEVLAIGRECDLAVLTVDDRDFWRGVTPITLADRLPSLQEEVTVVGFPVGGDNLAITAGVVSRIDMQEYVHGCCELLAVQIDAAINPGNSGGPAFGESRNGHECVGIAFQSLKDGSTENIGYIIPTEVANHFLRDVSDGGFTGFCDLGLEMQKCENPSLRASASLPPKASGLLVKLVPPTSSAHAVDVRRGDVLTHIDDVALADDGTIPFRSGGGRISFSYLLSQRFVGEHTSLRLLRDGKALPPKRVPLKVHSLLVPEASAQRKTGLRCPDLRLPSFFIVGGIVFCPLTEPYLRSEYGDDFDAKAPIKLLDQWQYGMKSSDGHQVIVLSQVLAHMTTIGYEHLNNYHVTSVNGEAVTSLPQLVSLVENNRDPWLRFDLERGEIVVLDASKVAAVTSELLHSHQIPSDRSSDLRALTTNGAGTSANVGAAEPKSARGKRARG